MCIDEKKTQTIYSEQSSDSAFLLAFQNIKDKLPDMPEELLEVHNSDKEENETDIKHYRQHRYRIVSIIGYLIGIEKERFGDDINARLYGDVYESLEANPNAKLIRSLCILRSAIEINYINIYNEMRNNLKSIYTLSQYIPADALQYVIDSRIVIDSGKKDALQYIVNINNAICSRIALVKPVFPDWIKWDYVKELFIMPGGTKREAAEQVGAQFSSNRFKYPFQKYLNWKFGEDDGNILFCDEKFVTLMYENHKDYFTDLSLVRDISREIVDDISGFIDKANNAIIVVDCENSDPIKLAGFLDSMSDEDISKIKKILLFDSHYTQKAWRILNRVCKVPVEYYMVERLIESKSQVDLTLATETCKAVYKNDVDAIFLCSSDSDYWAMIKSIDTDANFLVMVESGKTGTDIKEALESKGIYYCYLDNFSTDLSYQMKVTAILDEINEHLEDMINFNLKTMLDEAVQVTWTKMTDYEKKNIYNKYLKDLKLDIDRDGNVRCRAE